MFPNVRIVLVETSHPGNIGASARAMKNMAITNLVLVSPQRFPDEQASFRAVSALDVVHEAKVVDSVEEAIVDCQLVIGTSARDRRIPWPLQDARGCAERVAARSVQERVAILFGREDRGLLNEELQRCNLHCHIPTHEGYSSLNLAMAVQIVAYELRMRELSDKTGLAADADWDTPFSSSADMARFYAHLEETLVEIGFLNPEAPRQLMPRLNRLFNRVRLDEMELNILRGILTETQKASRRSEE